MKKLMLLFACLIVLGTSACRKVTENYYTTPNQTIFIDRTNDSWSTADGGLTWQTTLPFFEDDIYLNDFDGLFVYFSYDGGTTYNSLPQVYNGLTYSFSATNSDIQIEVQDAIKAKVISNPGAMLIKVVMVPSEE